MFTGGSLFHHGASHGRSRPQDHLPRCGGPFRRHALVWLGGPFLLIGKAGFLGFLWTAKPPTKFGCGWHLWKFRVNMGQPRVFCPRHHVWRWWWTHRSFSEQKDQRDKRWLQSFRGSESYSRYCLKRIFVFRDLLGNLISARFNSTWSHRNELNPTCGWWLQCILFDPDVSWFYNKFYDSIISMIYQYIYIYHVSYIPIDPIIRWSDLHLFGPWPPMAGATSSSPWQFSSRANPSCHSCMRTPTTKPMLPGSDQMGPMGPEMAPWHVFYSVSHGWRAQFHPFATGQWWFSG